MKAKITTAKDKTTEMPKHISEVENGIMCNCICFECNNILVAANNGKIQEHHFKHKVATDCKGSPETGLHLLAKRILAESNRILISANEYFEFQNSLEEKNVKNVKPDIQIFSQTNEYWFIEIAVTHFVDSIKLKKLTKLNVNCLEINLNKIDRDIKLNDLKEIVLNDLYNRTVLNRKTDESHMNKSTEVKDERIIEWIIAGAILLIGIRWLNKNVR